MKPYGSKRSYDTESRMKSGRALVKREGAQEIGSNDGHRRKETVIQYLKGDATHPSGTGPKIIAHITNNAGAWGAGFVMAISRRWALPERKYRATSPTELGTIQVVGVGSDLHVANMCAQDNKSRVYPPVRYDSLRTCLQGLADAARTMGASVHMPRIGCGIGGGSWPEVEKIVAGELEGIDVTVYDLP